MRHRPFTPDDDAYLVAQYGKAMLKDMAVTMDRHWGSVQQRVTRLIRDGRLQLRDRHYHRPWTEDDEAYLADNWGVVSTVAIAKHLRRSPDALKIRATRFLKVAKRDNVYTMRQTARIFGVDDKTPLRWAARGWLKCSRAGYHCGGGVAWNFDHDSIERFIIGMPWAYDWRRMGQEGYFRHIAEKVNREDPWLTLPEVCEYLGWQSARVDRWRSRGFIPWRMRPKQSQHGNQRGMVVVRKADLEGLKKRVAEAIHRNRSCGAKYPRVRKAA